MKKYEYIVNGITENMKKGLLKKGDKLPSVRSLSKEYQCNKDTVLKALSYLTKEQLIYAVPRSGHYVLIDIFKKKEDEEMDFKNSLPDLAQFSFADFSLCLNQVLNSRDKYLFVDTEEERGQKDLVQSIFKLLPSYSVYTKMEQLFITTGAQQAFYILSNMNFGTKKKTILIEQPTYNRMNKLIKELNLPYKTINRTLDGIDLKELEKHFSSGDIKFFYTISKHHYPLGISYKESEKIKIVELASKYQIYIIEDDYMADFDNAGSLPLHYYDISDRVIYIKSFSSIVFSSLRLALVVLPLRLTEEFLKHKKLMDYDTNFLIQKALSIYIDNGMFLKHRNSLLALHSEKNQELKRALRKSGVKNFWIYDTKAILSLKDKKSISELKKTLANKYKIDFLETCYITKCPYQYIKIDVRNMAISDIQKNLSALVDLLFNYIV